MLKSMTGIGIIIMVTYFINWLIGGDWIENLPFLLLVLTFLLH